MPAGYRDARSVAGGLFQRDETLLFERYNPAGKAGYAGWLVGYDLRIICFCRSLFGAIFAHRQLSPLSKKALDYNHLHE